MECDYCHRNEDELKNVFSSLLDHVDKKAHLSKDGIDLIVKNMDSVYGFSLYTPGKLAGMDKTLLNMPIELAFGEKNYNYLVKEHPALKYIKQYYYDKVETKLSGNEKLNELLKLYSKEPSKELIELEINQQTRPYIKMMEDIEEKSTIFYKIDNITKISYELFGFKQETTQEIHDNFKTKTKDIILCPYCTYVFTGGKGGNFARISSKQNNNTQQQSQYKPKMIYAPEPLCKYFGVTWHNLDKTLLKKNYFKMLSEYHPDKVNTLGIELRNLAEEKTKEIITNYKRLEKII